MHHELTGTLPVHPYAPDGVVGAVQSDGQRPQVVALACETDGTTICLSLVGAPNSVSSALARLLDPRGRLYFEPAETAHWDEPRILRRDTQTSYKEISVRLRGTLAAHGLVLPLAAHLGDGLVDPPVIPHTAAADPAQPAPDEQTRLRAALALARPRYLFGNWCETTPNRRSFLGVLRGLRAVFVNAPADAEPALASAMHQWADALWRAGCQQELIAAVPSLGIRAWRVSGDLARWSDLISAGVRERWLVTP